MRPKFDVAQCEAALRAENERLAKRVEELEAACNDLESDRLQYANDAVRYAEQAQSLLSGSSKPAANSEPHSRSVKSGPGEPAKVVSSESGQKSALHETTRDVLAAVARYIDAPPAYDWPSVIATGVTWTAAGRPNLTAPEPSEPATMSDDDYERRVQEWRKTFSSDSDYVDSGCRSIPVMSPRSILDAIDERVELAESRLSEQLAKRGRR